jgi:hypothetical protein
MPIMTQKEKERGRWGERVNGNGKTFLNVCLALCHDSHIQWGKKIFSQPPIVQVLPLKKMRPVIFIIGTLQL